MGGGGGGGGERQRVIIVHFLCGLYAELISASWYSVRHFSDVNLKRRKQCRTRGVGGTDKKTSTTDAVHLKKRCG